MAGAGCGHDPGVLEADAPRVRCPDHGVTVAAVPWARHDARHTREFDDQVAWLVTHTSKSAVVELMRTSWRTVGAIAARVVADARAVRDPFDGLTRIGIDEISYRRGHKYLMVVVDHDTGRLVWAAEGHDRKTLQTVLRSPRPGPGSQDPPGQRRRGRMDRRLRARRLRERDVVSRPVPHRALGHRRARRRASLDVERAPQDRCRTARPHSSRAAATRCGRTPQDLTDRQRTKLAWIARHNRTLYRAYLLKEHLRLVFQHRGDRGRRDARRLARLGAPVPHPGVRRALPPHQASPGRDHRRRSPTACRTG